MNLTDGKITLGVTADQLIIFGKDEKEPNDVKQSERKAEEITVESGESQKEIGDCERVNEPIWLAICIGEELLQTTVIIKCTFRYRTNSHTTSLLTSSTLSKEISKTWKQK